MKRAWKWTARVVFIVWTLLFITCPISWIRSYRWHDEIGRELTGGNTVFAEVFFQSSSGRLFLCTWSDSNGTPDSTHWYWDCWQSGAGRSPTPPQSFLQRRGFLWARAGSVSYTTCPF